MRSPFELLSERLSALWKTLRRRGEGFLPILRPVAPWEAPPPFGPIASLAILLGILATSGVAVGALAVLVVALAALWFLVSEVLGISIEVKPFPG